MSLSLCSACLTTRLVREYKSNGLGLCARCTRRKNTHRALRPETAVWEFLERDGAFPPVLHDKCDPLSKVSCCRRRVDFRMDYLYFQVLVEVDEHQHARYGEACEMVRLLDVVSASGGIATLLFRLNPDAYTVCGAAVHTPLQERLLLLKDRILRRTALLLRRIAADASRGGRSLMPLLYTEYLFYSHSIADSRTPSVSIRSYHDDVSLARAALKCR